MSFTADADALEAVSRLVGSLVSQAQSDAVCLDVSGSHGSRQGVVVTESVREFGADLSTALADALRDLRDFGTATSQLAAEIRRSEDSMTVAVTSRVGAAESEPVALLKDRGI